MIILLIMSLLVCTEYFELSRSKNLTNSLKKKWYPSLGRSPGGPLLLG